MYQLHSYYATRKQLNERTVQGILLINGIIFALWNSRSGQSFCERWFLNRYESRRFLPMLGSAFSHFSFPHFLFNMLAFNSFAPVLVSLMGYDQFIPFYLSAGVFSSLFSKLGNTVMGRTGGSLGASGAIVAMVYLFSRFDPNQKVSLMFLPFQFKIKNAVNSMIAFDTVGALFSLRTGLDHFGHLGGYAFAFLYFYLGMGIWIQKKMNDRKLIVQKQREFRRIQQRKE